ncbi:MAG: hypothetical protein HQL06_14610 [Nitrospirae bacterium]|nr:hypothetical protein [Nitrospirota bacterium]
MSYLFPVPKYAEGGKGSDSNKINKDATSDKGIKVDTKPVKNKQEGTYTVTVGIGFEEVTGNQSKLSR